MITSTSESLVVGRYCVLGLVALLSACVTTKPTAPTAPHAPRPPELVLTPAQFSDIPDWTSTDPAPAFAAFQRSCRAIAQRPPGAALATTAKYGGKVEDWMPACAAALTEPNQSAREFFEKYFKPFTVSDTGDGVQKLTGYYEPVIQARTKPEPGFDEPIYSKPSDLLQIDLGAFAKAYNSPADTNLKGVIWGRVDGKKVVPYPSRGERPASSANPLAYAHPADVYDLQVQGSGRVVFPDGPQQRASYAGGNGWKWNSIYKVLKDRNEIPADQLNKPTVRAWMDRAGRDATRELLSQDPSEVFFVVEPIADPEAGPKGAQGVPLTAGGSLAVDPAFHPYGSVLFLAADQIDPLTNQAGFRRLVVAQDTGGAIRRGPLRGDFFMGTGEEAGANAQKMNTAARWWTLLPNQNAAIAIK